MIDPPSVTTSPPQVAAVIHLTIPRSEIQQVMGPALKELFAALAAQGLQPAGPWFSHHLRFPPGTFDFEVGVPLSSSVVAVGRVMPGSLPAARVARTILHGDYAGLAGAWGELDAWARSQGHTPREDLWEVYLRGPESGAAPASWQTQLNRPLA
jgi:effector-binding domain-containing protein